MEELIHKYFEIEWCGVKNDVKTILPNEHQRAFEIMNSTTKFIGDRYECDLLWKFNEISFPASYELAVKRLKILENKFRRN